MTDVRTNPSIDSAEHDSSASAKRTVSELWNGSGFIKEATALFTKPYDRMVITYTDSTKTVIDTIVTKLGGVTQETITNNGDATTDDLVRS